MGYACPVCETPQADAHHLANHLAFTALLGNDDHEAWLAEHAPGWEDAGEDELSERVVEHASEVEFPQVFEDTAGHDHDRDGPQPGEHFEERRRTREPAGGRDFELDAETRKAIEEAREMTRQTRSDEAESNGDENE